MAENSKIEWTHHTFNPWVGCTKVSPACDHCYAEAWAKRTGHPDLWNGTRRRTTAANWRGPLKWNREAEARGVRYRVFCASLADVFDNAVPQSWRVDLFALIRNTPNLDWLLLTKRIGNVSKMCADMLQPLPPNVWLGATVVTQDEADRDVPKLLETPARVRFLSMEPLLEPVQLHLAWRNDTGRWDGVGRELPLRRIDWVIVGGESGAHARRMDIEWVESLREQCAEAGAAFFMKQGSAANWTEFKNFDEFHDTVRVRQFPTRRE